MKYYLLALIAVACSLPLMADGEIPGAPQSTPILLQNARIHVGNGEIIENGNILFSEGKIVSVGANVTAPQGAEVIDCSGKNVYPGFITPESTIGLVEIGAVRATRDNNEVGYLNPNVRAETAYNPDSEIIPTVRSNGVLLGQRCARGWTPCWTIFVDASRWLESRRHRRVTTLSDDSQLAINASH